MSEWRTVWQSGTGMKITSDAGTSPVPHLAKAVQYFLTLYRTEIMDAGMPMPASVPSMRMPDYLIHRERKSTRNTSILEIHWEHNKTFLFDLRKNISFAQNAQH